MSAKTISAQSQAIYATIVSQLMADGIDHGTAVNAAMKAIGSTSPQPVAPKTVVSVGEDSNFDFSMVNFAQPKFAILKLSSNGVLTANGCDNVPAEFVATIAALDTPERRAAGTDRFKSVKHAYACFSIHNPQFAKKKTPKWALLMDAYLQLRNYKLAGIGAGWVVKMCS